MLRASLTKKLGFALGVPFALLVTTELGLRLADFEYPAVEYAQLVLWNPAKDVAMRAGEDLHAPDPSTLWAPRPGGTVYWSESGERVNLEGYRGPLRDAAHPAGALRIVTLGDSSTFGLGVEYAQTFSAQLEAELIARGRSAEVLDFGTIGFTVAQGVERYRERARHFHADVVVAAFGAVNEHWPVADSSDADKLAWLHAQSSGWHRFMKRMRRELRLAHLVAWLQLRADGGMQARHERWVRPKEAQAKIADRSGATDWNGRRRVSPREYTQYLEVLRREVERDGAQFVLVSMPRRPVAEEEYPVLLEYTRETQTFAAKHGLALCDAHALFRSEPDGLGPDQLFRSEGEGKDYWHPSPKGHEQIARILADALQIGQRGSR